VEALGIESFERLQQLFDQTNTGVDDFRIAPLDARSCTVGTIVTGWSGVLE